MNHLIKIPSHLVVGPEPDATLFAKKNIEKILGEKIREDQHHSVVFISPEKQYVLNDLAPIFDKTRFQLPENQYFFFVIKKAETLSHACSNKLLKILEEPPARYIFFLISSNEQSILATIRSRCFLHHVQGKESGQLIPNLLTFFLEPKKIFDPAGFESELKKEKPSEQKSVELLNKLIEIKEKKLIELVKKNEPLEKIEEKLSFFRKQLEHPPQAGSSALFWKKIFLTAPR